MMQGDGLIIVIQCNQWFLTRLLASLDSEFSEFDPNTLNIHATVARTKPNASLFEWSSLILFLSLSLPLAESTTGDIVAFIVNLSRMQLDIVDIVLLPSDFPPPYRAMLLVS